MFLLSCVFAQLFFGSVVFFVLVVSCLAQYVLLIFDLVVYWLDDVLAQVGVLAQLCFGSIVFFVFVCLGSM